MDTRQKIINQFMIDTKKVGFKNVRVSHICQALKLERKLFYYYFEDKYAVLSVVYQEDLNEQFNLAETNKDNWQSHAVDLLTRYRTRGKFYIKCINEDDSTWQGQFEKHMIDLFQQLFVELSADDSEEVLFFAEFYANGWTGLVRKWIQSGYLFSEKQLIEQFNDLIRFTKKYINHWQ